MASPPRAGDPAPAFCLPSTEERPICLDEFRGKQAVVLYFYPRDDTPGCTAEACAFRDLRAQFEARGAVILGVSTDSVRSHVRFRQKYGLDFPLLSDADHRVAEQYGVWQEKKFMGLVSLGVARATFVIGRDGIIKAVFPKVRVEGHATAVLDALRDDQER